MLLIIASLFQTNNIAANAEHIAVVARIILTPYIVVKYLINTVISIISCKCTNFDYQSNMHSNTSKINSISQDSYNYHESVKSYKVNLNQSEQPKSRHQPEGWQQQ